MEHIVAIASLTALCGAWIAIQYLARRTGTKNHFEHEHGACGNCSCGGGVCVDEKG